MSGWLDALSIGGAAAGGFGGEMARQGDVKIKKQALTDNRRADEQKAEIARLSTEVRAMIAEMNAGSRENVAKTGAASRETVANTNAASRQTVAETNAGARTTVANTQAEVNRLEEAGRTSRFGDLIKNRERDQDLDYTLGLKRDATTQRGQNLGFDVNNRRIDATERGQTIGAATADKNRDAGALTADKNRKSAADVAAGNRQSREKIEQDRNRARGYGALDALPVDPMPTDPLASPAPRRDAMPTEIVNPPVDTPAPRSPEAGGDKVERLTAQAKTLLAQFNATGDTAQKQALAVQLKAVRDQLNAEIVGGMARPK